MIQSPPSRNTADNGSLSGAMRLILTKFLQGVDDMLPAQIISYNRASNIAQVQPLIPFVTTSNTLVNRAQVLSVPVLQIGGGGFVLSFPIVTGDLGWIKANDRDISIFKQTLQSSAPNTQRKHKFSDAMFIPDTMLKGVSIADDDAANLVIQNLAGTVKISLSSTGITFTGPVIFNDGITIDGIPFDTHRHTNVENGPDDTGGPIA